MYFICPRGDLSAALGYASQAVSSRAAVDVLKGLLFSCGEGALTITGFDLDLAIIVRVAAEVRTEGAAVLDARVICEMVRRASGEEIAVQVDHHGVAHIDSEAFHSEIASIPAGNYPALPEVEALRSFTYAQAVLRRQLSRVLFSVSTAETKQVHTGVLFETDGDALRLVALDGHRLAICDAASNTGDNETAQAEDSPAEPPALTLIKQPEQSRFVIPGSALLKLERMLEEDEESLVTISIGARGALIVLDNITVLPRLLEGEFFNYRRSLPKNPVFSALLPVKACIQALERVGLLVVDKLKNPVRLTFESDALRISCKTSLGSAQDDLPCRNGPEETLEIGFNHHYLLDALRRIDSEYFRFQASGAGTPCLILPEEGENPLYMVLPIRLSAAL